MIAVNAIFDVVCREELSEMRSDAHHRHMYRGKIFAIILVLTMLAMYIMPAQPVFAEDDPHAGMTERNGGSVTIKNFTCPECGASFNKFGPVDLYFHPQGTFPQLGYIVVTCKTCQDKGVTTTSKWINEKDFSNKGATDGNSKGWNNIQIDGSSGGNPDPPPPTPVYDIIYTYENEPPAGAPNNSTFNVSGVEAGTPQTVAAPPSVPGYDFVGWTLDTDGVVIVSNGFTMPDEDVYFTGKWVEKSDYKVYYDTDGGTPAAIPELTGVKWTQSDLLAADPTKQGYIFEGWDVTEGGDKVGVSSTDKYCDLADDDATMAITLTAQWTPKTGYTVNYDTNGGTPATIASITNVSWTQSDLLAADPTKTGFTFAGWDVTDGGTKTDVESTDTYGALAADDTTMEITLTAQWTPKDGYTVNYDTNGGTPATIASLTNVSWTQASLLPADPARAGFTFAGWILSAGGSKAGVVIAADTYGELAANDTTMEITLQAQWTTAGNAQYTVRHFKVSSAGVVAATPFTTQVFSGATGATVSAATATPPGYAYNKAFAGTKASGEIEADGSLVLTLYYIQNTYVVTVVGSYVAAPIGSGSGAYVGGVPVNINAGTRAGYIFSGWTVNFGGATLSNVSTTTSAFTMPFANVRVTANWSEIVNPPPPPPPPPGGGGGDGGEPTPTTTTTPTPTPPAPQPATVTSTAETIIDAPTPQAAPEPEVIIPPDKLPLASYATWALLNLILTIVTVIIMAALLITYIGKREDEQEEDPYYEEEKVKKHLAPRLITIAAAAIAIILFILTQNMSLPMTFFDQWTIWHVVITAASVVLAVFSKKTYEDDEEIEQYI